MNTNLRIGVVIKGVQQFTPLSQCWAFHWNATVVSPDTYGVIEIEDIRRMKIEKSKWFPENLCQILMLSFLVESTRLPIDLD